MFYLVLIYHQNKLYKSSTSYLFFITHQTESSSEVKICISTTDETFMRIIFQSCNYSNNCKQVNHFPAKSTFFLICFSKLIVDLLTFLTSKKANHRSESNIKLI